MIKKLKNLLLIVFLLCTLCFAAAAESSQSITVTDIQKYGNLVLSVSGTDFLSQGFTYGDIITATIGDKEYEMPIGTNYADVDDGSMICRVKIDAATGEDYVILAMNMGDLATTAGLAVKTAIAEEPGYRWDYADGVSVPLRITFTMAEPGGYYDEFIMRQLTRTNERTDYAHLSDAQFANFRMIATTGMGDHVLFRTSSPVNPELGRNAYADEALRAAGIKTIINLADTQASMQSYEGWSDTAYSSCSIIALNLGIDVTTEEFETGLAAGLRFLMKREGPYLVHCNEGKDRAGFVSALLECLMGASADEVILDYMTTYYNYYGVQPGSEQYEAIAASNIQKTLASVFGISSIYDPSADLAAEAEAYLLENLQLTQDEVSLLKQKLSASIE